MLVSHELALPPELERLSARFSMSLPDDNERAMIVNKVVVGVESRKSGQRRRRSASALDLLVRNLAGLTRADAERVAHNRRFTTTARSPPATCRA